MDAGRGHHDSDERSPQPRGGARRATVVLWAHRFGFLVTSVLAGWGVYHLVLEEIDDDGRLPWLFLPLWVLSAYVLLPRLNRLLTGIYVPSYFIGRARTSDGLLGDPVNLAVVGTPAQLSAAMVGAGWTAADTDRERDLVVSSLQAVGATVHVVEQYSTGYHARNGGGDAIETDGDLPIIDVRQIRWSG